MKVLLFVHTGNCNLGVSGYVANHLRVPVTLISKCYD